MLVNARSNEISEAVRVFFLNNFKVHILESSVNRQRPLPWVGQLTLLTAQSSPMKRREVSVVDQSFLVIASVLDHLPNSRNVSRGAQ